MKLHTALLVIWTYVALTTTAASAAPIQLTGQQPETINGIAIRTGVERLSYISLRYFGVRPAYEVCMKQSSGAAPKQQDCADTELTYQGDRLNRAYQSLLTALDDLDRRATVQAQRAWLAFRDKDCAARAVASGRMPARRRNRPAVWKIPLTAHSNWRTGATASGINLPTEAALRNRRSPR